MGNIASLSSGLITLFTVRVRVAITAPRASTTENRTSTSSAAPPAARSEKLPVTVVIPRLVVVVTRVQDPERSSVEAGETAIASELVADAPAASVTLTVKARRFHGT